jgi:hypothetical protein
MRPILSMRDALADVDVFGTVLAGESWASWRVLLIALCGEPLTDDERIIFESLTGRPCEPGRMVEEAFLVIGRRSGKTRAAAILACFLAALCDFDDLARRALRFPRLPSPSLCPPGPLSAVGGPFFRRTGSKVA